ncbi:class I SAM-dependent methyltransferase [Paracoccus sp. MBLB3053]|uniref:Class I SAM-dependent methyltransferase n=1 Tax=Paracoccus aurantius TaxID=3073814 RepID=A0ABU2HXG0_9RHOB|nr:class I SAM-dependent methyltransferase [Paracoccus sp. MBLB3053]MDS9469701.1 class I SAM-dependent methyltransferase [Paracoccus sp. MBLB3053]
MKREAASVIDHYTRDDLMERIRAALMRRGYDPDKPSIEMLSELDHLHGGGFATTEAQIELAEIPRGCQVLDAGCGIGGPSRYLAGVHGCTVNGIDLTPGYIDVAGRLNEMTGLSGKITLTVGSVTDLPYETELFDAVLCQNVSMNIADKDRMAKEALRVLKPGGIYTLSHLAEGPNGPPVYPLPWALTAEASFLGTPQDLLETLSRVGFTDIEDRAGRARSKPGGGPQPGTIGAAPAMGDDMPARTANAAQSVQAGRLVPMMVVARRADR